MTKFRYFDRFTSRSQRRTPSAIRALQPFVHVPGMISLGGGMPNPSTFPISTLQLTLTTTEQITLSPELLHAGLQYSPTPGLAVLNQILADMQEKEHHPPGERRSIAITTGSQDALSKTFDMLLDEDDTLLLEAPTYSGSLAYLHAIGCKLVGLATDEHGLIPESLEQTLLQWNETTMGKRPRVLYVIPTGSNPTGVSMTAERKQQIYEIASRPENDLIVLEDDPYYYLQFDETNQSPSLLSLDRDGRVLRFDSFSKILSSGMRMGYVTGLPEFIERINLHTQASNLHPCGLSQAITTALLQEWGEEGWNKHIQSVKAFYKERRDAFVDSAKYHLDGLAEWNLPQAGMFVWMKLLGIEDSKALIEEKATKNKVLLVPGCVFMPNTAKSPFVRAAYSTASIEDMNTALHRLSILLKESRNN